MSYIDLEPKPEIFNINKIPNQMIYFEIAIK